MLRSLLDHIAIWSGRKNKEDLGLNTNKNTLERFKHQAFIVKWLMEVLLRMEAMNHLG